MGKRHQGRVAAFQALYALDCHDFPNVSEDDFEIIFRLIEPLPSLEIVAFAKVLCLGVLKHLDEIDNSIDASSHHWKLERMSRVDRNVLRLAAYELKYSKDVPELVVISEGVELAKQFGEGESGGFVNGILNHLMHKGGG